MKTSRKKFVHHVFNKNVFYEIKFVNKNVFYSLVIKGFTRKMFVSFFSLKSFLSKCDVGIYNLQCSLVNVTLAVEVHFPTKHNLYNYVRKRIIFFFPFIS